MANVLAVVKLLRDVPHPKSNGVRSGYAPHHKFPNLDYLVSGLHQYADDTIHFPGEESLTEINFPSWQYFQQAVAAGDEFEVRELNDVVGYGIVKSVAL